MEKLRDGSLRIGYGLDTVTLRFGTVDGDLIIEPKGAILPIRVSKSDLPEIVVFLQSKIMGLEDLPYGYDGRRRPPPTDWFRSLKQRSNCR